MSIKFLLQKALLLVCILFFTPIFTQENYKFLRLDKQFNLRSKLVFDQYGLLWISDYNGLYRFNGKNYEFFSFKEIFGSDYNDTRQLLWFVKDSNHNIWLSSHSGNVARINQNGTYVNISKNLTVPYVPTMQEFNNTMYLAGSDGGIYKWNEFNQTITKIVQVPNTPNTSTSICRLLFTDKDNLWITTVNGRFYHYNFENKKIKKINGPYFNSTAGIIDLAFNAKETIYISTEYNGIFTYHIPSGKFSKIAVPSALIDTNKKPLLISLLFDSNQKLWASSFGQGIFLIDTKTKQSKNIIHKKNYYYGLGNNTISKIYEGPNRSIWMIDKNGIINILPQTNPQITYYPTLPENALSTRLNCVTVDSDRDIWLGVDDFGLAKIDNQGNRQFFTAFYPKYINHIAEIDTTNFWVATYLNGLFNVNKKTKKIEKISLTDQNNSLVSDIRYIYKDNKQRIWVTTIEGIFVLEKNKHVLAYFPFGGNELLGSVSEAIIQNKNNTLFIGTGLDGRLYEFKENKKDFKKSEFVSHTYYKKENKSTYRYGPMQIVEDNKQQFWIITFSGFLIKYNPITKQYKNYKNHAAFAQTVLKSVQVDNNGFLWIASNKGLHKFNLKTEHVETFYELDGFQGNNYSLATSSKDSQGKLYFGGKNGLSVFNPKSILKDNNNPSLYIHAIEILNKPAKKLLPKQFLTSYQETKKIVLKPEMSSFSFQFSAFDHILNSNTNFFYRLKGFNDTWVLENANNLASFTNIPPGEYIFQVKANLEKPNKFLQKEIAVIIMPFWWQTKTAIIIYVAVFLLLLFASYRWIKLRNKLIFEEWSFQKEKELYEQKMIFFAKMSHEILTPITLILGPVEDIIRQKKSVSLPKLKERLALVRDNAKRLSRISERLSNIRKVELGNIKLEPTTNNIVQHLSTICKSFREQAKFKQVTIVENYSIENLPIAYDKTKIEHVFYNLLANAIKFSPKQSTIEINLDYKPKKERLKIAFTDYGCGIPKEEQSSVFQLYYQSNAGKQLKGSGIGLALSKEMVELHGGKLKVNSKPNISTTFTLQLNLVNLQVPNKKNNREQADIKQITTNPKPIQVTDRKTIKQWHIMLVEDNIDMQIFLMSILEKNYFVTTYQNGKEALQALKVNLPNLIISDVMMPIMDGFEMGKKIKTKAAFAHIPIIYLTAKNTETAKLEALQAGGVSFIKKPFSVTELELQVQNTLLDYQNVNQKAVHTIISNPTNVSTNKLSYQNKFLQDLTNELRKEVENTDFHLEDLEKRLNMSYSTIYKKCHDLLNKSLVEYFRELRLKQAAYLIITKKFNISDAAYMVGYKDSKYFTKCFKIQFNITPTGMKREAKENEVTVLKKYNLLAEKD